VKMEAVSSGVTPTWSEIVGLVPERVLIDAAVRHLQLDRFTPDQILERRVRAAIQGGESLSGFVASVAASTPTPGGGSVAAHAGALAAALAQMVAGLTIGKKKYAGVEGEFKSLAQRAAALGLQLSTLVTRDADSYAAVSAAYKLPKEPAAAAAARENAIADALIGASEVPLETARACAEVADLALVAAERGNTNAVSDAGVAALLAEAACRGAAYNVQINVASLPDRSRGDALISEATALVTRVSTTARRVTGLVEKQLAI
jgi:glutamate formiminotransferase / formiminotetrahydrofolate cyclodeaminase